MPTLMEVHEIIFILQLMYRLVADMVDGKTFDHCPADWRTSGIMAFGSGGELVFFYQEKVNDSMVDHYFAYPSIFSFPSHI